MIRNIVAVAFGGLLAIGVGTSAAAADAYLRVVDVGNGLCVVARTPDGHSMLYDAGESGSHCLRAVREIIPEQEIDLVVLSHSDMDHIAELPAILAEKRAKAIYHPGDAHISITSYITKARTAIGTAKGQGARVVNLLDTPLEPVNSSTPSPQRVIPIGAGKATIIAGWGDAAKTVGPGEPPLDQGEHNNAVSIVVKFEFGGHSVLLTGDTVGRHIGDPVWTCKNSERLMVERNGTWPLKSDVLVGQHHGADNASSRCFIDKVAPEYVVFSAGHKRYRHPRTSTVRRMHAEGVAYEKMLRTDRGDDEPRKKNASSGEQEWVYLSVKDCKDQPGDDDVEIWLPSNPTDQVRVEYRRPQKGCGS